MSFCGNNDTLSFIYTRNSNLIRLQIINKNTGIHISKLASFFKNIEQYSLSEVNNKQGFGLSIAKYYIEELNGHLIYSSSSSLGFEFSVEFNY